MIRPYSPGSFQTSDIAVAKVSAPLAAASQIMGLAVIGRITDATVRSAVENATTAGYPGRIYSDASVAAQDDIVKREAEEPAILRKLTVNAVGSGGAWQSSGVGAEGHSGGGVWVTGPDGRQFIVGNFTYANATGPLTGSITPYNFQNGNKVGGNLLTCTDLFKILKLVDVEYRDWRDNPKNWLVGAECKPGKTAGTFRSDIIETGDGAVTVLGSGGEDEIRGGTGDQTLTYSGDFSDLDPEVADVSKPALTAGLVVTVDPAFGGFDIAVKDGYGTAHQKVKGVETIVLSALADRVELPNIDPDATSSTGGGQPIGATLIDGGDAPAGGADTLDFSAWTIGLTYSETASAYTLGALTLKGFEGIEATAQDDVVRLGSSSAIVEVKGGAGRDTLALLGAAEATLTVAVGDFGASSISGTVERSTGEATFKGESIERLLLGDGDDEATLTPADETSYLGSTFALSGGGGDSFDIRKGGVVIAGGAEADEFHIDLEALGGDVIVLWGGAGEDTFHFPEGTFVDVVCVQIDGASEDALLTIDLGQLTTASIYGSESWRTMPHVVIVNPEAKD